jgi:UDP-N-acetylenolpyruvoylglucosamine reductase
MATMQIVNELEELTIQFKGAILRPGDAEYDKLRNGWNLSVDQHPALILIPNDVEDVKAAMRFADKHNVGVTVKLTGHGVKYPADDNLMIIPSLLNGVSVDAEARTARVEGGVLWQQVLDVTTPHGLAPLLGTSPHVGVVGYTLGGGNGWLARRYGLAVDSVLSIDLVTPGGELRHTSPIENRELFWGLRGGGGNFGVVTAMEFKLYPVATLYGGSLTYPGELARDALRFYREWLKGIPDELTTHFGIYKFPDLPQLPEAIRGKTRVILRAAYDGDVVQGQCLLQPWLDWQTPLANAFRQMPFAEIATISNDNITPVLAHPTNDMLNELSDEVIEIIVRNATANNSPLIYNELRHAGGAIARVERDANAVGNRDASFYLTIGGVVFAPEMRSIMESYIRQYKSELRPYLHGGIYLNFSESNETRARVQDAFSPQAYARLLALKAKYDPKNLFRYSYPLVDVDN